MAAQDALKLPQFAIEILSVDALGVISGRVILNTVSPNTHPISDLEICLQGSSTCKITFQGTGIGDLQNAISRVPLVHVKQSLQKGALNGSETPRSSWPFKLTMPVKTQPAHKLARVVAKDGPWVLNNEDDLDENHHHGPLLPPSCRSCLTHSSFEYDNTIAYGLFVSVCLQGAVQGEVVVQRVPVEVKPSVPSAERLARIRKYRTHQQSHRVKSFDIRPGCEEPSSVPTLKPTLKASSKLSTIVKSMLKAPSVPQTIAGAFNYAMGLRMDRVQHLGDKVLCEVSMKPEPPWLGEQALTPGVVPPVVVKTARAELFVRVEFRAHSFQLNRLRKATGATPLRSLRTKVMEDQIDPGTDISKEPDCKLELAFNGYPLREACSFRTPNICVDHFVRCEVETVCGGQTNKTFKEFDIQLAGPKSLYPEVVSVCRGESTSRADNGTLKPQLLVSSSASQPTATEAAAAEYERFLQYRKYEPINQESGQSGKFEQFQQFLRFQEWQREQASSSNAKDQPPPYQDGRELGTETSQIKEEKRSTS